MKIVLGGVSGSGKTTIGIRLAERLGYEFADADGFHPPENIAKMSAGIPLTDEDRAGWIDALGTYLAGHQNIVLACSALKKIYRDRLRALGGEVTFIVLTANSIIIEDRMAEREHFMPASLLASQLATLEVGADVTIVANTGPIEETTDKVLAVLR